jgi:hypothetical protein
MHDPECGIQYKHMREKRIMVHKENVYTVNPCTKHLGSRKQRIMLQIVRSTNSGSEKHNNSMVDACKMKV